MSRTTIATSLLGRVVMFGVVPNVKVSGRVGRVASVYVDKHVECSRVDVEFANGDVLSGFPTSDFNGWRAVLCPESDEPLVRALMEHATGYGVPGIGATIELAVRAATAAFLNFDESGHVRKWSVARIDLKSLKVELIASGVADAPYTLDVTALAPAIIDGTMRSLRDDPVSNENGGTS